MCNPTGINNRQCTYHLILSATMNKKQMNLMLGRTHALGQAGTRLGFTARQIPGPLGWNRCCHLVAKRGDLRLGGELLRHYVPCVITSRF